jgi:predicted O-methyltransferase YrrM
MDEVFGQDDADLAFVRDELVKKDEAYRAVGPHEARILQFLVRGFGVKRVVEIGTLYGYSALAMAKALPDDGLIVTVEKDPAIREIAMGMFARSSVAERVKSVLADAEGTMAEAAAYGPFDMAFIDANKAGYVRYLDWAEENVRRGGLIVGDNTFLFGAVFGESRSANTSENQIRIMNEFNRRLADPQRYNSLMTPTFEGMTVGQKLF